jgi:hypothetical protein
MKDKFSPALKTPSCLIGISSAAALFDVPPRYLQSLVDAGVLKVVAIGRYKRLQFDEVARAMREGLTVEARRG